MMYGWDYGQGSMIGFTNVWMFLIWLIVLIDLVLLGVWLWKQIQKK